jgi:hypothetical protein
VENNFHLEVMQAKDVREKKHPQVGFKGQRLEGRVESYISSHTGFMYTSMGLRRDKHEYPWVREGQGMDICGPEKGKSWMHWEM